MRPAPALLLFLGWCWLGAAAAEPAGLPPLPEPLTLEHALSLADGSHPELESARAALDGARAERHAVDADFGTRSPRRAGAAGGRALGSGAPRLQHQ